MTRKFDHVVLAYENSMNTIKQADTKATISITIQSLLVSVGLAGSLLMGTFEKAVALVDKNAIKKSYFVFFGIFTFLSIIGIIASILVYFPITSSQEKTERDREGYLFFEHIKEYKTSSEYKEKLESANDSLILEDLIKQTHSVSKLASTKINFVRASIILLLANLISCILVLILSGIIGTIITNGG